MSGERDIKERLRALEAEGFKILSCDATRKKHYLIWFEYQGRRLRLTSAGTSSDHRGLKNFVSDAWKIVKNVPTHRQREKT